MKALILLVTFFFGMAAQAADVEQNNISNQQFSRRPYAKTTAPKAETFEGDVVSKEEQATEEKHKTLRLHQLGRRPYSEKNTD
jgi:hypothetical protein